MVLINEIGNVKSIIPEINLKIELRMCRGGFNQSCGTKGGVRLLYKSTIIRVYLIKEYLNIHIAIYCLRSIHCFRTLNTLLYFRRSPE